MHRQDLKPSLGTQEIPKCTRLERSQDTAWGDIPRGRRDGDLAPGSSLRHAVLAGQGGGSVARAPERDLPDACANTYTTIRAKVGGPESLVFHVPQQRMTTQLRREGPPMLLLKTQCLT